MTKPNIVDEKARIISLTAQLDAALRANDYELAWAVFQLMSKHMGKLMAASAHE
jgi:pentatricopeptide repeat protein